MKIERTDNCIRYYDWERQGLKLSEGDPKGVEWGLECGQYIRLVCWPGWRDRNLSMAHSHLLCRKWSLTCFLKVCIPLREGGDCRSVGGS